MNVELASIRENVLTQWTRILNDDNLSEEAYQSFLTQHAGFFWTDDAYIPLAFAKIRLGADVVTDFVVPEDRASLGWFYTLIEIESPHTPPFTKSGKPSARLTQALQQILDWQRWATNNPSERDRLFPPGLLDNTFRYEVIIGKRDNTAPFTNERNEWTRTTGISIRSFDAMTDRIRSREFQSFYSPSSAQMKDLSKETLNQLANPFVEAISDAAWREMRHQGFRGGHHILAKNAGILLSCRSTNEAGEEKFDRLYRDLSPDVQRRYAQMLEFYETDC